MTTVPDYPNPDTEPMDPEEGPEMPMPDKDDK